MLNVQNIALCICLKKIFSVYFFQFLFEIFEMKKPEQNTILISNLRQVCSPSHSVKHWFPRRFYG